jgi:hypothetical protein
MRSWWLVLAGCNGILGLDPTHEIDAPPDAPRLLTPTSTTPPCPAPIAFDTWHEDPAGGVAQLNGIALYRAAAGDRAMVTRLDADGWRIYDTDLAADYVPIESLHPAGDPAPNTVGVSPGGDVVWFQEGTSILYGARDSGWTRQLAQLGYEGSPGSVGYYAGTARMVIGVEGPGVSAFVEVSSTDGVHWAPLDTLHAALPSSLQAPTLSRDGCVLLFIGRPGATNQPFVAFREANGAFETATAIPTNGQPHDRVAFATDVSRLWSVVEVGPGYELTVLHP